MKWFIFLMILFFGGCQSVGSYQKKAASTKESPNDVRSAIESVAGAVSAAARVKYCPTCGRRFSPQVNICPVDGTQLKEVEP
ncbi:MAG TPA: hypothetical protein PLO93_02285 [Candidatus Omnitrophota bacterium]|nr:hypothetical protein [Candidatus Omnitrophota bacterium]HQL41102.1 hypothetical protein [Candidatus Omnitrophota bacterium]